MRPKARGLARHGSPPGYLEESDPAGVILYMMDRPYLLPFPGLQGQAEASQLCGRQEEACQNQI